MVETQTPLPDNNDNNCDKTMANNSPKISFGRALWLFLFLSPVDLGSPARSWLVLESAHMFRVECSSTALHNLYIK